MSLRIWRLAALMLAALTTGMGLCHLMEMPARMSWEAPLWVGSTVEGGLYRAFGTVGAVLVVATVAATAWLAFLVRRRGRAAPVLALAGAGLFAVALLLWWIVVYPVNLELATWTLETIPQDWDDWRARWETGHAVNAALQILGLAALLQSVLVETPE